VERWHRKLQCIKLWQQMLPAKRQWKTLPEARVILHVLHNQQLVVAVQERPAAEAPSAAQHTTMAVSRLVNITRALPGHAWPSGHNELQSQHTKHTVIHTQTHCDNHTQHYSSTAYVPALHVQHQQPSG
jgi:hypothetical protein